MGGLAGDRRKGRTRANSWTCGQTGKKDGEKAKRAKGIILEDKVAQNIGGNPPSKHHQIDKETADRVANSKRKRKIVMGVPYRNLILFLLEKK